MTLEDYLAGLALVAVTAALVGLFGWAGRRLLLPAWTGARARLAEAVLALSLLLVAAELLGTVGALRRGWLVLACALAAALALVVLRRRGVPRVVAAGPEPAPPLDRPQLLVALAGAGLVLFEWGSRSIEVLGRGMADPDTLWYHMPFAARFAQDGFTTRLQYVEAEPMTTFHPASSELLHGAGIALMGGSDLLSPFLNLGFACLALLAGWCVGRAWGAAPAGLLAAALVLLLPVIVDTQPGEAANDAAGLAFLLCAAGLLANAARAPAAIGLAAAATGLAVGTKLSLLAAAAALTVGVVAAAPRGTRVRAAAAWCAPLLLTGGFWYLRNLFRAGNPLPWIGLDLGPLELPSPPTPESDSASFSIAHYADDPGIWRTYFLPNLDNTLGDLWPLTLTLAGGGALLALARPRFALHRVLGAAALFALAAYLITPATAGGVEGNPSLFGLNLRFLTPGLALGLAALVLSPLIEGVRRQRVLAGGLGALVVVTFVSDGLLPPTDAGAGALLALALLLVLAVLLAAARGALPRAAVAAVLAALAALALVVGRRAQTEYLEKRYAVSELVTVGEPSVWARKVRDASIGYVGYLLNYPLYGPDLSNRVEHVGRRGEQGAFAPIESCRAWAQELRGRRYDYVITTPAGSVALAPDADSPREPREGRWTRRLAGATEVLRVPGSRTSVFRLDGAPDPGDC